MNVLGRAALLIAVLAAGAAAESAGPPPLSPGSGTFFGFESDPQNYLGGQGQRKLLTEADGTFTVIHEPGVVMIDFLAPTSPTGTVFWSMVFEAPWGTELVPGVYDPVVNAPSPRRHGIDVRGEYRFCIFLKGRLDVLEAEYEVDGTVKRFAADFEQHCDDVVPALFGSIHYRSTLPPPTPRPPGAATPTPDFGPCWGDCSDDGEVTIEEIVLAVRIALDSEDVTSCPLADRDGHGDVTIDELGRAVNKLLSGCQSSN